jgi:hypothetical protein
VNGIKVVTSKTVTLINANGQPVTIPIKLTPKKKFLTQATQKQLLATGFMIHFGPNAETDSELIRGVMREIRRRVLAALGGGAE